MSGAGWYAWDGDDLLVTVHVQPRAKRDEVVGLYAGALKVRLSAPPVDGRRNAAVAALLADRLGVPPQCVSVVSGRTGRRKRLRVMAPAGAPEELLPA